MEQFQICHGIPMLTLAVVRLSTDEKASVTKCLHDGRLLEMTQAHIDVLKSSYFNTITGGGFGKEKIASRLMHFAIVPLIAHFEDSRMRRSYFLSPYLNNGSLFDALKCIRSKKDTILSVQGNRKKVLLHIASAIAYLHSEVKNFRGSVLHMDIKSNNIVLDCECNARLVDFGFARELKEGTTSMETKVYNYSDGYFPKEFNTKPTVRHDVYNFGVVIREVVTAFPPLYLPGEEKATPTLRDERKLSISEFVLQPNGVAKDIWKVSEKCISDDFSPSKDIHIKLETLPSS
ncbi:Y1105-like protein [Mya arenaria]|uniref:Y1105-like protein n=1 Tax=Mya arenaria TaxID=6604 RepID=A0ABY7E1Z3_MYAAR|nr:Y1105-like protein [Mya arenaria]